MTKVFIYFVCYALSPLSEGNDVISGIIIADHVENSLPKKFIIQPSCYSNWVHVVSLPPIMIQYTFSYHIIPPLQVKDLIFA